MRIAVCDDNEQDRQELYQYIEDYCGRGGYACSLSSYKSGEALLAAAKEAGFDVVFLDIYLPGQSGLEIAKKLRGLSPHCIIILVTVSTQHALDAYQVAAASYVVKPLSAAKMEQAFSAASREFMENGRVIYAPIEGAMVPIALPRIRYIEVFDKDAVFHLEQGEITARMPLDKIEQQLGEGPFLRCHRSYIVNLNYISHVEEQEFVLAGGGRALIRRRNRRELKLAAIRFLATRPKVVV